MGVRSLLTRVFEGLASLRLAVVTMLVLGTTCAVATFYESKHGTAAVQREFYKTAWFAAILIILGTNIFCAMMRRYPFKPHHAGFVMAHIGILTLLTGSLVSLFFGLDSNMALYEGESADRVTLGDRAVGVSVPGEAVGAEFVADFDAHPPRNRRFEVPGAHLALVVEEFAPHVEVEEHFVEGAEAPNPAVHFHLDNPFAKQDGWLVASDPQRRELVLGPLTLVLEAPETEAAAARLLRPTGGNRIVFLRRPGGWEYALVSKDGAKTSPLVVGRKVETPWMGMTFLVDQALDRAVGARSVSKATPPERDEIRMPAVKVHLEGAGSRSESDWLLWTETRTFAFDGRGIRLAYRSPEKAVPFRVTLLKFNSDKYPGSNLPATYESWVRVDDAERGRSEEHHISMNHPLHYRGYIFFQASFVEGQPMMSIFSVARAPGLPLVYAGVILIASGVAWMFYLKPYLARRQAARALEARKQEDPHAAKPKSVAPSPTPPEPASSRA